MRSKNRSSNELLLTILRKPGGFASLLQLANTMDIDVTRNDINVEQVQSITNQTPDELLLNILDQPKGLDSLVQVTRLTGMPVQKENITVEKFKEAISTGNFNISSHTAEDTFSKHVLSILGKITTPTVASHISHIFTRILPLQMITEIIIYISSLIENDSSAKPFFRTASSIQDRQLEQLKNFFTKDNPTHIEKLIQQLILSTQSHPAIAALVKQFMKEE